jgi:hypothetical protein
VILAATLHSEIVCAPCLHGHREGEYIIDLRAVVPDRIELNKALDPVQAAE